MQFVAEETPGDEEVSSRGKHPMELKVRRQTTLETAPVALSLSYLSVVNAAETVDMRIASTRADMKHLEQSC